MEEKLHVLTFEKHKQDNVWIFHVKTNAAAPKVQPG